MKLQKILSVLIVLILLLVTILTAVATETFHVSLKIHFIKNLMFSKYDVNIYLNDTELVTLKHGKDYSGSFDAKAGKNTLHFYRDGKKKVMGSLDFELDEDKEISCTISCYSGKIDVDKITVSSINKEGDTALPEFRKEDNEEQETITKDGKTATETSIVTPTATSTATPTVTPTATPTPIPTATSTVTATVTVTKNVTETAVKKNEEREAIINSLSNKHGLVWFGNVRNDKTGRWRLAEYSSKSSQETIALDYYKAYFKSNNEIHALINMATKKTACISVLSNSILDVTIKQYVKGEEHDAKELFGGKTLKEYWVYMDTGKIELID